jgi:hypothetical protein
VPRSLHRVYDGSGEGISGRVKFLPLALAGMPKTSFRKGMSRTYQRMFDDGAIF